MSREPTIQKALRLIVDRPGITAAEISEAVDIDREDVPSRLYSYVQAGKLRVEKKPVPGAAPVNAYFAGSALTKAVDGVVQIVTPAKGPQPDAATGALVCSFSSNGEISLTKDRRTLSLSRDDTRSLVAFIDAINIERILGGAL